MSNSRENVSKARHRARMVSARYRPKLERLAKSETLRTRSCPGRQIAHGRARYGQGRLVWALPRAGGVAATESMPAQCRIASIYIWKTCASRGAPRTHGELLLLGFDISDRPCRAICDEWCLVHASR